MHTGDGLSTDRQDSHRPTTRAIHAHKVTTGLRERCHNSQRSTTKAIRCGQSDESAQALVFSKCAHHEDWTLDKSKTTFCQGVRHILSRSTKYCACHEKRAPRHPNCAAARNHLPNQNKKTRYVVQGHQNCSYHMTWLAKSTSHFDPRMPKFEQRAENATPARFVRACAVDMHNLPSKIPSVATPFGVNLLSSCLPSGYFIAMSN